MNHLLDFIVIPVICLFIVGLVVGVAKLALWLFG